jgi:hypothetical protein
VEIFRRTRARRIRRERHLTARQVLLRERQLLVSVFEVG